MNNARKRRLVFSSRKGSANRKRERTKSNPILEKKKSARAHETERRRRRRRKDKRTNNTPALPRVLLATREVNPRRRPCQRPSLFMRVYRIRNRCAFFFFLKERRVNFYDDDFWDSKREFCEAETRRRARATYSRIQRSIFVFSKCR